MLHSTDFARRYAAWRYVVKIATRVEREWSANIIEMKFQHTTRQDRRLALTSGAFEMHRCVCDTVYETLQQSKQWGVKNVYKSGRRQGEPTILTRSVLKFRLNDISAPLTFKAHGTSQTSQKRV